MRLWRTRRRAERELDERGEAIARDLVERGCATSTSEAASSAGSNGA